MDQYCSLKNTHLQLQKDSVWAKYCFGQFNFWGFSDAGNKINMLTQILILCNAH